MLPDLWYVQTRPTELGLAIMCLAYGLYLLAVPEVAYNSQLWSEIAWLGFGRYAGFVYLSKTVLTGWGVLANIHGFRWSQGFRFCGAAFGSMIWSWTIYQDYDADNTLSFASFPAALFLAASLWVLTMSLANLPRPGKGT